MAHMRSEKRPVAVVTGASRGIGRAIALHLAEAGFDLVIVSRSLGDPKEPNTLAHTEALINQQGRRCLAVPLDISDLAAHASFLEQMQREKLRLDVVVCNAGIAPPQRLPLLETTPENWDTVMGVNLRGTFFFAQALARYMISTPKSPHMGMRKFIFITSISAYAASVNRVEYCAAKAGLSLVARCFAVALAPYDIAAYEVRPGLITTDMTAAVHDVYTERIQGGLLLEPRWGTPDDVARAVRSLAVGDFDYSTGTVFEVSGGFGVSRL